MSTSSLLERFETPHPRFYPTPVWWWSGDRLDPRRLRWQMERLAAGGARNLVIMHLAPNAPAWGKDGDDPPHFSEEWWAIFEGVCRDAKELEVTLWLYDQIGFGGADLLARVSRADPQAGGLALDRAVVELDGPGSVICPPAGTPIAAAFVEAGGAVHSVPLSGRSAEWEGRGRLMLFHAVPRGFDFLSGAACADLIGVALEPFAQRVPQYLGGVIVGSFQDELPPIPTWAARFPEQFRRIAGYDLVPRLAELWEDLSPDSGRVRRDFHRTRGKLAEDAFFRPLHDWHERHGMLSGFDQDYGARDGDPAGSGRLYGDYLRTHRWFSAPGSDHQGDAKIHSSLAHSYERERVWIEAFHSSGWGGTLEETFDWLLPWIGAGANLYDPHATYYATRRGWWEWAPPATDWRQPYWRHYMHFARAVARLCGTLSWGTHACEVAVLFPSATAHAALRMDGLSDRGRAASEIYREIVGTMAWHQTRPGVLNEICRDFDVLDDDTVAAAEVGDGWLAHHGERYRAVILPSCVAMEEATAARLVELVDAGGTLVAVGALPEGPAGMREGDSAVNALRERFARGSARHVGAPTDLADALADVPAAVRADVPTLCRRRGDQVLLFVPAAFPRASDVRMPEEPDPVLAWLDVTIDFDPSRWAREREVLVRGVTGAPQLWEPFSGRRRRLTAQETEAGVRVRVPFDDGPAALLVWGSSEQPEQAATPGGAATPGAHASDHQPGAYGPPVPIDGRWEAEIETAPEDLWGDLDRPSGDLQIEAWSLECLQDGEWAPAHATFGARARWVGPAAPEDLPAPSADLPAGRWKQLAWSPSRGIHKDPIHRQTLGPSGRVPEEFMRFGEVAVGEAVHVRTVLHAASDVAVNLLIGAAAAKQAWLDGKAVPLEDLGYLAHGPLALVEGVSVLDLRLLVEEAIDLRLSFSFVSDVAPCLRPEWIRTAGPARSNSLVTFRRELKLSSEPLVARALVGASGPCRTLLDDREIGRHAGYTAELEGVRDEFAVYDLSRHLSAGSHELRVEIQDFGLASPAALVDVVISTAEGDVRVHSDGSWAAERDGVAAPVEIRRAPAGLVAAADGRYVQAGDPSWSHLWRRPHPLPRAVWLEPTRPAAEPPGAIDARITAQSPPQRLRVCAPPGAERAQISPAPGCRLTGVAVDGRSVPLRPPAPGEVSLIALPTRDRGPRIMELSIDPAPGLCGGGVLADPVRFATGVGSIELGDWRRQGLCGHSGGVRYRRTVKESQAGRLLLDLGTVRGTAEVFVDGESVGVRVCSPYRFELSASPGSVLEVLVTNTLAPHLDAVSPTHYVLPGQKRSGLFGPATLAAFAPAPPATLGPSAAGQAPEREAT